MGHDFLIWFTYSISFSSWSDWAGFALTLKTFEPKHNPFLEANSYVKGPVKLRKMTKMSEM